MKNTKTLKSSNEFRYIMKKGSWFAGDLISIYILKNKENFNLLGIAVGKKFSKSSVKRNRVKRLLKEAYRLNEDKIDKGNSIVIVWKNSNLYENVNFEVVKKDLIKCFKKANILNFEEEKDV